MRTPDGSEDVRDSQYYIQLYVLADQLIQENAGE